MLTFNVFSSWINNRILKDIYSTWVVTHDVHGVLVNAIVTEHLLHSKIFSTTIDENIGNYGYISTLILRIYWRIFLEKISVGKKLIKTHENVRKIS